MVQVFVRTNDKTFAVSVAEDATLNDLKAEIENVSFFPANLMRLVKGTEELACGQLYGHVEDDDVVEMLVDVNGGMRAKWRKKRMRRLRRKRRKMRNRAK